MCVCVCVCVCVFVCVCVCVCSRIHAPSQPMHLFGTPHPSHILSDCPLHTLSHHCVCVCVPSVGWWLCIVGNRTGWLPSTFVEPLKTVGSSTTEPTETTKGDCSDQQGEEGCLGGQRCTFNSSGGGGRYLYLLMYLHWEATSLGATTKAPSVSQSVFACKSMISTAFYFYHTMYVIPCLFILVVHTAGGSVQYSCLYCTWNWVVPCNSARTDCTYSEQIF